MKKSETLHNPKDDVELPASSIAASEEVRQSHIDVIERVPGVIIIGEGDPLARSDDAPFPEITFHAYRATDPSTSFSFDAYHADGSTNGVNNQLMGAGLYCGDATLAGLYQRSFGQQGKTEAIIPNRARIIDTGSEAYKKEPVPTELLEAFLDYMAAHRLSETGDEKTKKIVHEIRGRRHLKSVMGGDRFSDFMDEDDIRVMTEKLTRPGATDSQKRANKQLIARVARRTNSVAMVRFALHSGAALSLASLRNGNIKLPEEKTAQTDTAIFDTFLQSVGVDGIQYGMYPSVDPANKHQAIAFWRFDRIGTREVWEDRNARALAVQTLGNTLMHMARNEGTPDIKMYQEKRRGAATALQGEQRLQTASAEAIRNRASEQPLLSDEQGAALWQALTMRGSDPYSIVATLAEQNSDLAALLSADVGVWEQYRLHEHTQAVLGQFEKHFARHIHSGLAPEALFTGITRLTLLLQDIGKPLAVSIEGSREKQATYNRLIAGNILDSMPLDAPAKELVLDLLSQNYLGEAVQNPSALERSAQGAAKLYDKYAGQLSPRDIATLFAVLYLCDASAYTGDAQYRDAFTGLPQKSKKSLDHLFVFGARSDQIKLQPTQNRVKNQFFKRARELSDTW